MSRNRMTIGVAALLGMTGMATVCAPACAQSATASRSYDIPAGAVGPALNQLGRMAGIAISYDPAIVSGKKTSGVRGSYNAAQALEILLRGTSLHATPDGAGGFVISAAPAVARRDSSSRLPATTSGEAGDIIVTGNRFQNSLINRLPIEPRELPFSLDVIGREEMDDRGFFNPLDILETVPNIVRIQTQLLPSGGAYFIRGLTASVLTNNRPENDSRGAGRRDTSHIERFEVVKGPASILLGPVIPGGAINQVTKSPQENDFLDLTARGGSYGTYRLDADANTGALLGSEVFSGRITLAYEDQRSPQDPVKTEMFSVRPVLEANFSDRTRAQASVAYTERNSVPGSSFPVNEDGSLPDTFDAKTFLGVPAKQVGKDTYLDVELQHEFLDDLKLVMRGSYQDSDFDYQSSQSGENYVGGRGFGPGDTMAYVYYSHGYRDSEVLYGDLQLVGGFNAFGQRQDWVIGASARQTKFDSQWAFGGLLGVVDINNIDAAVYGVPDFSTPLSPFSVRKDQLYSVYAETNIRPTDRLTIVAGARYDDYKVTNRLTGVSTPSDDVTFRIGASYELVGGLNAYASYAESFIPQNGTTRSGDPIKPESATNYEIGLKGALWDNRLTFTAAAFSLTRQNVATADPNNVPGQPAYVIATGEQKHKGFEISGSLAITPALKLDLAYGYVDAEITRVINADAGQDVGDPVQLVPHHTFSAFGSYTVQEGALAGLKLGVGGRGISRRPAPRFGLEYEGYTLVDALIAYPISERFSIQLNVQNLLDEKYRESIGYDNGTPATGHRFGNPRTAYVTARARF